MSQSIARFCSACGAVLHGVVLGKVPERMFCYAGFWLRAVAAMIDGLLCQIVTLMLAFPLGFTVWFPISPLAVMSNFDIAPGIGFGIVVQWLWYTLAESSAWQASIGKRMLGLQVTDLSGKPIDFMRANGRYWSKLLSGLFFGFGFLMVAFSDKKQGLHDKLAGTLILKQGDC